MSRATRNLASLLVSQVATWAASIVTLILVPRYLGPTTFGVLGFALAFVGFVGLIVMLGADTYLVKTVARDTSSLGVYVFNALAMKLILSAILATSAIGIAYVAGYTGQTLLIVEVASIGMVLGVLNGILAAGLQGTERMGRLAAWAVVQQYISGGIGIALLLDHKGVVAYALVIACGGLIPVVANAYQLWPELRGRMHVDFRIWRSLVIGGLPFFAWNGVLLIYGSIDILILDQLTNSKTVGWYTLAYGLVGLPASFAFIVVTAFLPSLSVQAAGRNREFSDRVNKALRLVVFVGTPIAVGIALVATDLFTLLHYQHSFSQAIPLLRILCLHIPIVGMDMVLAMALNAKDRQNAWLVVGCVAAVFNPLLNLVAIPLTVHLYRNGAIGASIVTVATEGVMMIGALYLRPRGVMDRATTSYLLRCTAASLLMIPPVLLVSSLPFPVKISVGVIAFSLASFVLRTVTVRSLRDGGTQVLRSILSRQALSPTATALEHR